MLHASWAMANAAVWARWALLVLRSAPMRAEPGRHRDRELISSSTSTRSSALEFRAIMVGSGHRLRKNTDVTGLVCSGAVRLRTVRSLAIELNLDPARVTEAGRHRVDASRSLRMKNREGLLSNSAATPPGIDNASRGSVRRHNAMRPG
jgi:hypothetical protein